MCKKKIRKDLYEYARGYKNGLYSERQLKERLSEYIVDIVSTDIQNQFIKCIK